MNELHQQHFGGFCVVLGLIGALIGWLASRLALHWSHQFRRENPACTDIADQTPPSSPRWEDASSLPQILGAVGSPEASNHEDKPNRDSLATESPVELPLATSRQVWWMAPCLGLLFAAYWLIVFRGQAHATHEVRPDLVWMYGRAIGHLVLLTLLVTATATDFLDYIIPDSITVPGMLVGIGLATFSGDTQLMHLWVDWNHPHVAIYGQWIPEWIKQHHHWHGLAWSLAGLVAGGGLTWLSRIVSGFVLKQESLGFGDVTLMAMIGSFIGWQPVLFVFLIAPLCGLIIGLMVRTITNRSYVPYGPYLSLAAVIVLGIWKWLWQLEVPGVLSIRKLFGDPIGLGILSGIGISAFVLLLVLVRLYRLIPGRQP